MSRDRGAEAAAVLAGADAEGSQEGAPHRLRRAVPAAASRLLNPVGGIFQVAPGRLEPDQVDVTSRRHAHLGREGAGELARGKARLAGQRFHGQVRPRVVGDPPLHVTQRLPVRQLPGELGAELGLVPRAAQEHHQMPGDIEGRVPAEVVFHQGQREVDPGGDPRRGGDVPVPDEDRIRIDAQRRVLGGQRAAVGPVGRHPPPVEQAGLGEQEGARAHRDQAARPAAVLAQPSGELRAWPPGSFSPGHDQQVRAGPVELAQVLVGRDAQAARGPYHAAAEARGADVVSRAIAVMGPPGVSPGEHLERAGHVQALHLVEEDHQHRAHVSQCDDARRWQQ